MKPDHTQDLCPQCQAVLECEEVDIGVGTLVSSQFCNNCGWSRQDEIDKELEVLRWD